MFWEQVQCNLDADESLQRIKMFQLQEKAYLRTLNKLAKPLRLSIVSCDTMLAQLKARIEKNTKYIHNQHLVNDETKESEKARERFFQQYLEPPIYYIFPITPSALTAAAVAIFLPYVMHLLSI